MKHKSKSTKFHSLLILLSIYNTSLQGSEWGNSINPSSEDDAFFSNSNNSQGISLYNPTIAPSHLVSNLGVNSEALNRWNNESEEVKLLVSIVQNSDEDTYKKNQAAAALVAIGRQDIGIDCYKVIMLDSTGNANQRLKAANALEHMNLFEDAIRGYTTIAVDSNIKASVRLIAVEELEKMGRHDLAKSFKSDI